MNDIKVEIEKDNVTNFLEEFTDIMYKAKQSALRKGANVIKKGVKSALKAQPFDSTSTNPKYSDRLIDGIRTTKMKDDDTVGIHILGSRAKTSGTFRLRFFEKGTKIRYAKTYKGKPLRKPRKLGKIDSFRFFESGVASSKSEAQSTIEAQLKKYIDKAWNNG